MKKAGKLAPLIERAADRPTYGEAMALLKQSGATSTTSTSTAKTRQDSEDQAVDRYREPASA